MKKLAGRMTALIALFVFSSMTAQSNTPQQSIGNTLLTATEVELLLNSTTAVFEEHYIDPSVTAKIIETIEYRFNNDYYAGIETLADFAAVVGKDFQDVSGDLHLSLFVQEPDTEMSHIIAHEPGKLNYNYAFEKVSYLSGNIGYLKFNKFHPDERAKATVDSAFAFLSQSSGLIIDMRDTVGGSPELVQYMLSYFIKEDKDLWTVSWRENDSNKTPATETFKSLRVPNSELFKRNYPIWIVTSNNTASASELFVGVLQAHKKAIVVGGNTAGAGYYVGVRRITDNLTFRISLAKPIISISNEGWEKKGILPNVKTDAVDALDVAIRESQ